MMFGLLTSQPAISTSWLTVAFVLVVVALFGIGLALLFHFIRHKGADALPVATEEITEIAGARARTLPAAHLIAKENFRRLPLQIDLYYDREVSMGRNSRVCNVLLDDMGISRRHATIRYRNGRFYLRDDGSKGGTYLYKARASSALSDDAALRKKPRLTRAEERALHEGDVIQFYTFSYQFHLESESTEIPDEKDTQSPTQH